LSHWQKINVEDKEEKEISSRYDLTSPLLNPAYMEELISVSF